MRIIFIGLCLCLSSCTPGGGGGDEASGDPCTTTADCQQAGYACDLDRLVCVRIGALDMGPGMGGDGGEPDDAGMGGEGGAGDDAAMEEDLGLDEDGGMEEDGGMGGMGGGPPPMRTCSSVCLAVGECALSRCAAGQRPAAEQACAAACMRNPAIVGFIGPLECPDLVEELRGVDPSFDEACGVPGAPGAQIRPVCQAYGENIAACVVPLCPRAEAIQAGLANQFGLGCEASINRGEIGEPEAQQVADAECAQLREGINGLVGVDPNTGQPGFMQAYCQQGDQVPAGDCARACAQFLVCEAPVTIGSPEGCAAACVIGGPLADDFRCVAVAEGCPGVEACNFGM